MLKRVIIAPKYYLEQSAAILACQPSARHLTFVQLRWGTAGATNLQYGPIRYPSWHEELHGERSPECREISTRSSLSSIMLPPSDSTEYLANTFVSFLQLHARTTKIALRCLKSGLPTFSLIHEILKSPQNIRRVANYLAASANPDSCIRLLALAVAYGPPPSAALYEGLCWTLSQHKQYALMLQVCLIANDSLGIPKDRLLGWWLRAACEIESYASVGEILQKCEDAGVELSRRTWHLILTVHLRNRDLLAARQCLKSMKDAGIPPDPTTHVVIATNYRHLGRDSQVQNLVLSILDSLPPSKAAFVVNQLLETHLKFDDEQGFLQLFSLFEDQAIEPIRVLLRHSTIASSTKPLPNLESLNLVIPNVNTFLISVRFCVARSDFSNAEKIFFAMEQQGFDLSPSILAAFLNLQFALARPGLAVLISSRLLATHGFETEKLFNQLALSEPDPLWLWPSITAQIPPSVDIFNVLLRGLVNVHGFKAARIILTLMKRTRVRPNSYTLKILIDCLVHAEKATSSLVLRTLRQLSPLFRPSLYHLHPILSSLLRDERRRLYSKKGSALVQSWAARTGHQDVDSDLTKPVAGLRSEYSTARPSLVRSLLQSLESRGIRSDSVMLGLRMRYEAVIRRDTTAAVDVYKDMLARGMTPSLYHTAALMEAFTQQGETDNALKVMHSMNVKPNLVMYTILLQGYANQGQPQAAVQLFQEMVSNGIQADVRAIGALCRAFILARRRIPAREFLLSVWTSMGSLPEDHDKLSVDHLLRIFSTTMSNERKRCRSLKRNVVRVVIAYKRTAGLPRRLLRSSPKIRQAIKRRFHVSRKL